MDLQKNVFSLCSSMRCAGEAIMHSCVDIALVTFFTLPSSIIVAVSSLDTHLKDWIEPVYSTCEYFPPQLSASSDKL